MVVPVIVRGCPAGVMIFFRSLVRLRYLVADLDLAEELGKRVGVTLENGRLFREARRADRRKEEFLALLGHELRNPLAPILTTLEVMRLHGDAFARERQLLERHARHLSHLVDDLLDISRITRGKIQLELRPVLLEGAVTEAIESVSPLLAQRGHHLKRTETAEQAVVAGDATRLAQIIGNLLHNAAQYTPPGGHLEVASALDGDNVIVQVRDDGEGISPEMLPASRRSLLRRPCLLCSGSLRGEAFPGEHYELERDGR